MKTFICLAALLLPLVASVPSTGSYASFTQHGRSYGYNHGHGHAPAPAPHAAPAPKAAEPVPKAAAEPVYKPAEPAYKPAEPAYKPHPAPTYGHYAPAPTYHQPSYGYEYPKHNCSVQDVTENADVCTPTLATVCENVDLPIKIIVEGEYCYDVARTVCSESSETIDNEVCSYNYEKKYEDTTARTVEVTFKRETDVQMVTVCQPGYGHGYHSYGHQYCKEVAQETAYNVPVVSPLDVPVRVGYPEPIKTCVNKPITLPRLNCEVVTEKKCVAQPEVADSTVSVEKCTTIIGEPSCQEVELALPKQVCVEIVYGYAHDGYHN